MLEEIYVVDLDGKEFRLDKKMYDLITSQSNHQLIRDIKEWVKREGNTFYAQGIEHQGNSKVTLQRDLLDYLTSKEERQNVD